MLKKSNKAYILIIFCLLSLLIGESVHAADPIKVTIEGKAIAFTQNPRLVDNRVLVPMRTIFEKLGATVTWDSVTQTVYAKTAKTIIVLKIGSLQALINKEEFALDVPAQLIEGTTMVPIRFVSEALGQAVSFNSVKQTVLIRSHASVASAKVSFLNKLIEVPTANYDKAEVKQITARLGTIEEAVLRKLVDHSVKIKLVNGPVTDVKEYSSLKGVVPRGWEGLGLTWDDIPGIGGFPVVIRIGYSDPSYDNGHNAINLELHETAHAIDSYVFDDISQKDAFKKIWSKEAILVNGVDGYTSNYPEEYFAEAFAMYHLNEESGEKLKKLGPLTYQFIKSSIEKL